MLRNHVDRDTRHVDNSGDHCCCGDKGLFRYLIVQQIRRSDCSLIADHSSEEAGEESSEEINLPGESNLPFVGHQLIQTE